MPNAQVLLKEQSPVSSDDESEEGEWHETTEHTEASTTQANSRDRVPYEEPLLRCTEAEKAEAMALILEIMSLDLDLNPTELIHAGIRADVVRCCYKELGFSTGALDDMVASTSSPRRAPFPQIQGAQRSSSAEFVAPISNGSSLRTSSTPRIASPIEQERDEKWIELQHRTAILEEQRLLLQELRDGQQRTPPPTRSKAAREESSEEREHLSSTEVFSIDAVKAMRQAAMDSMKRKRDVGRDVSSAADTPRGDAETLPPSPPKAPRQRRYRDVDAPRELEQALEEEAASALALTEQQPEAHQLDPRQAQRAHISYKDDYAPGVLVPNGQVDHSAPLPHLDIRQTRSQSPDCSAAHRALQQPSSARDISRFVNNGRIRRSVHALPARPRTERVPFIPRAKQRVVVAFSDDSSDDEDEEQDEQAVMRRARRQIQHKTTSALYAAWRKGQGLDEMQSTPMTPLMPADATFEQAKPQRDAEALLKKKEEEIESLKRRMREIEQKRQGSEAKRAVSSASSISSAMRPSIPDATQGEDRRSTDDGATIKPNDKVTGRTSILRCPLLQTPFSPPPTPTSSNSQPNDEQAPTDKAPSEPTTTTFPAYESVFARHPGLRSLIDGTK